MTSQKKTSSPKPRTPSKNEGGVLPGSLGAAVNAAAQKLETVKHVADVGRSTQETHRKAMDTEKELSSKLLDILAEQSKRAESPQERATIRDAAKEAVKSSREKIDAHKEDSNSVWVSVLKYSVLVLGAIGAVGAGVAIGKSKN